MWRAVMITVRQECKECGEYFEVEDEVLTECPKCGSWKVSSDLEIRNYTEEGGHVLD